MSNTATDINFQSVVDFLEEIQAVGPEILENAEDIAIKMEELFGWLLEDGRLSDMKLSVVDLFSEIANQPEFISREALAQMIEDLNEKIAEALGIESLPDFDLDLSEVLQEIKNMLPDDIAGIETADFTVLKDRIISIIDKVSDTGISFRATKDNPALTAVKGNAVGASPQSVKTPIDERSTSAEQTAPPDGEFDTILKDFFSTDIEITESLTKSFDEFLDEVVSTIEQAIANSGIMLEVENQILAVKDNLIKTKPLTLEVVFTEFADLVNSLGKIALSLLEEILELIITSFKNIYDQVQTIIPSITAPITNLVDMLNLGQINNPGIYTIPSILVSIPVTMGFTIVQSTVPGFPDDPKFPQDAYRVDQDPKYYGSNQFADGFASFLTGVFDVFCSEKNPKIGFWIGLVDKIWGVATGALAQNFSVPDYYVSDKNVNEKDFPTVIWEYQWFQGVAWPFVLAILYCFREMKVTDKKIKNHLEFVESLSVLVFEIVHLTLFSIQFEKERTKDASSKDLRLGAAAIIDPLPNIIGSLFNMYNLAIDPFKSPDQQGDTIVSSINRIRAKINVTGNDSLGEKLTAERAKLLPTTGELRTAFKNANDHLVGNTNGKIKFDVDRVEQLLTQNGEETLAKALSDLNKTLNISSIGTNEQDFKDIENILKTFQEPIDDCDNKTTEAFIMAPNLDEAWRVVKGLESLTSSSEEVKSVERKIKSFNNNLISAGGYINDIDIEFEKFHPENEYLNIAEQALDPTSEEKKTIGESLQNARTVLSGFQAPLLEKLLAFKALLNEIQTDSDHETAMDTLVDDLNPEEIDGLIGSQIENALNGLLSFEVPLNEMIAANANISSAISEKITNVKNQLQNSKKAIDDLQESLDTIIDYRLNMLSGYASDIADTLNKNVNANNLSAYGKLLRDSEVTTNSFTHGINKIKDDLSKELESAIKEAKEKIEEFITEFNKILDYVKATDTNLATAISALEEIPNLTARLNASVTESELDKLRAVDDQAAAILTPLRVAKTNLDLQTIEQTGLDVTNKANEIINSVGAGSDFINTITSIETSLSTGGSVGQKLEEIYGILNFGQATQDELKRPLELAQELIGEMINIRSLVNINSNPLKKELSDIDKGLVKVQEIGNKKESLKKKENFFFTIVPMSATILLKSAYGGLNWWVGDYPPPKFGKEKGTAAEKNKVFEVVSQSQENITLQVNIFNDFEGPKDAENFDNFDKYTLAWEKEVSKKWESLEDLNPDSNKKTITIDRKDLEYSIRVRLNYTHGFVIAEYKYPGPKAIKINLTNGQEASTTFELADGDNITNHVFGSLSAEDKDAITFTLDPDTDFQVNNTNEISLKRPITDGTSLSVTATDAAGNINQKTFTININPAPSNIQLAITKDQNAADTFEIAEVNNNKDYFLGTLSAEDSDPVTFGVTQGEKFVIDSNTNKLSLLAPIDDSEELEVTASDGKSMTSKSYTININKAPTNIEIDLAGGVVSIPEPTTAPNTIEITPEGNINGQVIGTLTAEDEEGDELTFSVDKTDDFAIINNNDIVELKLNRPIEDGIELVITASDTAGNFTGKTFVFEIL